MMIASFVSSSNEGRRKAAYFEKSARGEPFTIQQSHPLKYLHQVVLNDLLSNIAHVQSRTRLLFVLIDNLRHRPSPSLIEL
jgi:hypothetical protein